MKLVSYALGGQEGWGAVTGDGGPEADVISTRTPTGAGARFDPPKWLVPGDLVEVEVPGIGTLANRVADERP
jgi:hypothetical protein